MLIDNQKFEDQYHIFNKSNMRAPRGGAHFPPARANLRTQIWGRPLDRSEAEGHIPQHGRGGQFKKQMPCFDEIEIEKKLYFWLGDFF